ncbi:MAG: recombinase family protein [Pseudomonadota bacterium]
MRRIRCAIYTRKSTEEGLEQDFNSLDAQREACEAFIASQKHEGWELLPDRFDDGGISGGHLDRPALKRLMKAIKEKRVDQIVVYKIDRLTRSLSDFAKIVDVLDAADTSFVSVTQSFNTATSMGRLTLNMLLSFAQFEREVTAERIRDKIAASKKKGLWMGGNVPLGYKAVGRTLAIEEAEAATIRTIYDLYRKHKTVRRVTEHADNLGLQTRRTERSNGKTKGGHPFTRGHIHAILTNPIYAGRIRHKDKVYDGQHPAIIEPENWEEIQKLLETGAVKERGSKRLAGPSPLAGKLFDETGDRLTPSHSRKNGKRLRYYISRRLVVDRRNNQPDAWRLPAEQLENLIAELVQTHLSKPTAASSLVPTASAAELMEAQKRLSAKRDAASPHILVHRVDLKPGSMTLALDKEEIARLLNCKPDRIAPGTLTIASHFQMRRRGVELKLHLGDAPPEIDRTLVQNTVTARRWLTMIIDGTSPVDIAAEERIPAPRVHALINLAMLSPEILDLAASGSQPIHLTTDYLLKSGFPIVWSDQRKMIEIS